MLVPNRHGSSNSYRYGFNGKEKDDELKGIGNSYDFGARMLDTRVGRWFAIDPLATKFPSQSPYISMDNNPVFLIDPDGKSTTPPNDHYINKDGSIQTVKTDDTFDRFYVQNNTEYTLVGQLNKNESGLVNFPTSGTGFGRYGTVDSGGTSTSPSEEVGQGDHYLQPEVAAALFGLVNVLHSNGISIDFGDMSSSNGSDPWQFGSKHHAGHGHNGKRSGLDVDFRYISTEGKSFQAKNAFNSSLFSTENNQKVFDTASIFGFTKNYQGQSGNLTGATKVGGHNDHGHLGFQQSSLKWTFVAKPPVLKKATSKTVSNDSDFKSKLRIIQEQQIELKKSLEELKKARLEAEKRIKELDKIIEQNN